MWEGQIPHGSYWYTRLDLEHGSLYSLDLDLLSGGAVDILFMDYIGFSEFRDRLAYDTICHDFYVIFANTFREYHFPVVENNDHAYRIVWGSYLEPVPMDLFITNHQNFTQYLDTCYFDYYARYDAICYVNDTIRMQETEDLYFILDNTEFFGSPPVSTVYCTLSIGKIVIQPFEYFQMISILNSGTVLMSIQIPEAESLYLVINNAGYVEGGAVPCGSVEFQLNITEE